jgi:hypothetical protein
MNNGGITRFRERGKRTMTQEEKDKRNARNHWPERNPPKAEDLQLDPITDVWWNPAGVTHARNDIKNIVKLKYNKLDDDEMRDAKCKESVNVREAMDMIYNEIEKAKCKESGDDQ